MAIFRLTLEDGAESISAVFESDAARVLAYGMRIFNTDDKQAVVSQFGAIFMGKLTADARENEQQIAAKVAADAVPEIIVTPVSE